MAEPNGVPTIMAERLVLLVTGALSAATVPIAAAWLRQAYPDLRVRIVLTRTAERFVTRAALSPISGTNVLLDLWPDEPVRHALHAELNEWADTFVVYPATMAFIARFALGQCDSPVLLALQCTRAPVAVAPSLPPGAVDSVAYRQHLAGLESRDNVTVVAPTPAFSTTTGRNDAAAAASLPEVLVWAEKVRARLS